MIIDPSEITKKYAKKIQYLDTVRDGSEGVLSIRYWTCDGVAAEVGEPDIASLYHERYSTAAPDFKSENAQILRCIERISEKVDNRGIYVMDRGGDLGTIINPLLDTRMRFLIRLVGTRHLLYRGRGVEARRLAESCPLPYAERVVKEHKGKEKQYYVEFGFRTVQLPHRSERLYLVVFKGFGEELEQRFTADFCEQTPKILILSGMGYRPESGEDLHRYLDLFVEQKKLVLDEGRYWLVARS